MDGLIQNTAWEQGPHPEGKNVVGKMFIFKRKTNSIGEVERDHKALFIVLGYQQTEGLRFDKKMSHTLTASSTGMVLATAAVEDRELRHTWM